MVSPAPVVIAALGWLFGLGRQPNHMYLQLKPYIAFSVDSNFAQYRLGRQHRYKLRRRRSLVVERRTSELEVGVDPHSGRRVVSLSKIHLLPKKYW